MPDRPAQVKLLIAAPYSSARAGLRAFLANDCRVDVVAEASSADGVLEAARAYSPDAVLLDYAEFGGAAMLDAARESGASLVVIGIPDNEAARLIADQPGEKGLAILPREAEADDMSAGVAAASAGLLALSRRNLLGLTALPRVSTPDGSSQSSMPNGDRLSAREREVLQLLAQGLPNKQIAARLGITQHTVKFHVASILAKLGAASRTEAVSLAARRGELIL